MRPHSFIASLSFRNLLVRSLLAPLSAYYSRVVPVVRNAAATRRLRFGFASVTEESRRRGWWHNGRSRRPNVGQNGQVTIKRTPEDHCLTFRSFRYLYLQGTADVFKLFLYVSDTKTRIRIVLNTVINHA